MYDLFSAIECWSAQNKPIASAIVVRTWGSSPRAIGSKMVMNIDGEMAGSVSGGCVEAAVVETGIIVLKTGVPKLLHYGITDEMAWDVGLACGGEIEVFVHPLDLLLFGQLKKAWEQGIPVASGVIIQGSPNLLGKEIIFDRNGKQIAGFSFIHTTGFQALVIKALDRSCPQREILQFTTPLNGSSISGESINAEIEVFVDVITPRPTLVIVGGVHIAIHLVSLAKILGYRTVLIDPRSKFGSPERFPNVDLLINSWPQDAFSDFSLTSTTAVAILTHDPKIDDRALEVVLPSPVFYIGALGSKKTQRQRRQRLLDSGFSISQVNKIRGPIGLNLGGRSPEEIALSIMSEITKVRNHN